MHYIFVINGRADKAFIQDEVREQLSHLDISYDIYVTDGAGDGTRFVNVYCDLNPKDEVCFVACGGAGTANEVMSGLVNRSNKCMAILHFSGTNDFCKNYPDRNFTSIKAIVEGEPVKVDVIKANDNYSLNVVNVGMDAWVCALAQRNAYDGDPDPYNSGVRQAVLKHRLNKIKVTADGVKMNHRYLMDAFVGNGQYCGGEFRCNPEGIVDDGWMEVLVLRIMSLMEFLIILPKYKKGEHLNNGYCRRRFHYMRAKHVELRSKDLIYLGLDGEVVAASYFELDLLEKSLNLILPKK